MLLTAGVRLCGPAPARNCAGRTTRVTWESMGRPPPLSGTAALDMNGVVCCPTCDLPAIVEDTIYLSSTDGPVEHLRISCIGGHGWLLLADRVSPIDPLPQ